MTKKHEAIPQNGFISKTISIEQVSNDTFKILIELQPLGKEHYTEELKFNRHGLKMLIDSMSEFTEIRVH